MDIVYDIKVDGFDDIYVKTSEEAMHGVSVAGNPGSFMVDTFTFCEFSWAACLKPDLFPSEVRSCMVSRCWFPKESSSMENSYSWHEPFTIRTCQKKHGGLLSKLDDPDLTSYCRQPEKLDLQLWLPC